MDDGTSVLGGADARALDDLFKAVSASGRGHTVFVAGDDATARSELLREWAGQFARLGSGVTVIGGTFAGDSYMPWQRDTAAAMAGLHALEVLLERGQVVVLLEELALPRATERLLGHVLSKSRVALAITHRSIVASGRKAAESVLPDALRRLCEERPVVLVLEPPEEPADRAWADIMASLARCVADDLPLLLVLALDGPERLEPVSGARA